MYYLIPLNALKDYLIFEFGISTILNVEFLNDRQKRNREEANNNSSNISKESKRRKKVTLRHTSDIFRDTIIDKT